MRCVALGGLHLAVDDPDARRRHGRRRPTLRRLGPAVADELSRPPATERPRPASGSSSTSGTTTNADGRPRPAATISGSAPLAGRRGAPDELVRAPDRRCTIGWRPAGAARRSDTSRSAWTIWPSVRGMGVAVISSTCGALPLAGQRLALGDAEAVLLVDHHQAQVGEGDGLLDQRVGADDDPARGCGPSCPAHRARRAARAPRVAAPRGSEPVSSVTSWPSGSSRRPASAACWRASRSVGASSAAWWPASATKARASAATAVLPEPTSPWSSRIIGRSAAQVGADVGQRRALVVGQAGRRTASRRARARATCSPMTPSTAAIAAA